MLEVITIALFAITCAVAIFRVEWAFALVVLLFPLKQALQASGIFLSYYALPNVIVVGVTTICLLREITSRGHPLRGYGSGAFWGTTAIYVWSVASLLWTPSYTAALEFVTTNVPYLLLYVFVGVGLIRDIQAARQFLRLFLWLSAIVAVVILVNPNFSSQSGRMGLNMGANMQSNPLAIGELGGIMIIVSALARPSLSGWMTNLVRVITFLLGVMLGLQSGSRGQMIFSVLLAILFVPVAKRMRNIAGYFGASIAMALIGVLVLLLSQYVLEGQGLKRWDADSVEQGVGIRVANVVDLLSVWATNPIAWIFGLGLNAFSSLGQVQQYQGYTHNIPTDILAELGLPAFVIFVAIWVQTFKVSKQLYISYREDDEYRSVSATLMALVVFEFLLANKQGMLWVTSNLFMWPLLLIRVQRYQTLTAASQIRDRSE